MRKSTSIIAIAIVAGLAAAPAAARPTITLYSAPNYQGKSITIDRPVRDLDRHDWDFGDRAQSAQVRGRWQLCAAKDFQGRLHHPAPRRTAAERLRHEPPRGFGTAAVGRDCLGLNFPVMPAQAGIQRLGERPSLDSRFRGNDNLEPIRQKAIAPRPIRRTPAPSRARDRRRPRDRGAVRRSRPGRRASACRCRPRCPASSGRRSPRRARAAG